jgi:hypothetical protein
MQSQIIVLEEAKEKLQKGEIISPEPDMAEQRPQKQRPTWRTISSKPAG